MTEVGLDVALVPSAFLVGTPTFVLGVELRTSPRDPVIDNSAQSSLGWRCDLLPVTVRALNTDHRF